MIIPDILYESYLFIQHNYYVKNITSSSKVFENNISSYKLFNKFIKKNFELNINNYLTNLIDKIPLVPDCIGLIIISCELILFSNSIDVKILDSYKIISLLSQYLKIYLFNSTDRDTLVIYLNCLISLFVGIEITKGIETKTTTNQESIIIIPLKNELLLSIIDKFQKLSTQMGPRDKYIYIEEKYFWHLLSIPEIINIINSFEKKYNIANVKDNYDYDDTINLFEQRNKFFVQPKPIDSKNYNFDNIKIIELMINKSTNKLYNYISYYCYLLTNFFKWEKIYEKYILGKVENSGKFFNYSILFDNISSKYYKVNQKNIDLIINSNPEQKKLRFKILSIKKIDEYIVKCPFLLDKDEIIDLINSSNNLTRFINKLNKFIVYEQLMFWKDPADLSVQIEIPEYNISFLFKNDSDSNLEGIIKFKNYDLIFDYNQEDTLLIFNLVSNVPNLFLIKNSQENEYYLLNINKLFYWDIVKIHYSGLFILFENDIGLLNYLSILKNYWANYIIIKNIKNNITFKKIFSKDDDNKNTIEESLKETIQKDTKVLYSKMIINYTKTDFFENIYIDHVKNLGNLTQGYIDKIKRLWFRFNLPFIFEIQEYYSLKKIFFDCIYFENLTFYKKLLNDNSIKNFTFNQLILKNSIEILKNLYEKRKKKTNESGYYSKFYDSSSEYSGGGKKKLKIKKKDKKRKKINTYFTGEINEQDLQQEIPVKDVITDKNEKEEEIDEEEADENEEEVDENEEDEDEDEDEINICNKYFKFDYELTTEFIEEIKNIYEKKTETLAEVNNNFSIDALNCFLNIFYPELKPIFINTVDNLNLYFDDYVKNFIEESKKISKSNLIGGGYPQIPELYQYKSYQDNSNQNNIILIEWISNDKLKNDKPNYDTNIDTQINLEKKTNDLIKRYEDILKENEYTKTESKFKLKIKELEKKKNIWDRWDSLTINSNSLDLKITDNILVSLNLIDFVSFINKIIILYNDKIVDLFYNSSEFRYICLMFLFKKIKSNGLLDNKSNFHINTTITMLFYQFVMGGLVRDEQIKIIGSILSDYGFSNKYLDIIKNTYEIEKKCNYRELINSGSDQSKLYTNEPLDKDLDKDLDDNVFIGTPKRNIYNLIMGSGKTKFITPLICIYVCELIKNKKIDNNMLLILPPKLVNQSKIFLSYILEYFLNINVEQIDKTNVNTLNMTNSNGKLLLCSDENFKYYFLGIGEKNNKFIFDKWDRFKNIVLIDEADIILDPMSSEMNYPLQKSKKYFNQIVYLKIIDIIFDLFKSENNIESKNILITKAEQLGLDIKLYIDFMNFIKLNNYPGCKIDNIFDLFIKQNPKSHISILKDIDEITYSMYDYIYNIFLSIDTVWNMVNRKDFGFVTETNEIITPFKYSETPMIGSEFNGIFLNMMLTVKAYEYDKKISFYKLCKLMKFIISELQNINLEKFKYNQFYKFASEKFNLYDLPNLLFRFNINLADRNNLINTFKNLNFYSKIEKMLNDKDIIIMYCKYLLYKNLYYYEEQLNISGIDITFSQFFNYLSGFTGTPEDKFEYIDINPLKILKKNPKSICAELDALKKNTNVLNYTFDFNLLKKFSENYDYKNFVLSNLTNYSKYNVIIDVGSVFINLSFYELAELFFNFFSQIERFVFIDNRDEIFYIDKKDILTIIPWDYSIFNTDLVFFDNSHITGIDFVLPINFIGLVTMRANTRYRDFIQGLYRLRKINSTQKADIFILPNIFGDPIVTNEFTKLLNFKEKSNGDKLINIAETNLEINNIISILETNEQYYFINQQYYFNIQELRVIKTFYKHVNSLENPNIITDSFNKITSSLDDYLNNKIINEIKVIENSFILTKKDFIQKYFCQNFNDLLPKICQIIKFYKKILLNDYLPSLSTQLQIQTQQQYQNEISISVQTQINKSFSNTIVDKKKEYAFEDLKMPEYSNYLNIDDKSLIIDKKEKDDTDINFFRYIHDEFPRKFINTYLINSNNYKQTNSSDLYLFSLSDCLMYSNQLPIYYEKKLYLFNSLLIIYLKNIKNDYTFANKKNLNLFKAGEFYEILNLSIYYRKESIPHIVFDIFGNIIENYDITLNDYEKSLSSNIRYYFASIFMNSSISYNRTLNNYLIPNYKYIFNYTQVQKIICINELNLFSILDIFESMNISHNPTIFSLEKIYSPLIFTILLILLQKDSLLTKNINLTKFIKNNFIQKSNPNLKNEFSNLFLEIIKLLTNTTFKFIKDIYDVNKDKYMICNQTNFVGFNRNSLLTVNFNLISKCVGKILKKDKIWSEKDNLDLRESLNIFRVITRLLVSINKEIEPKLFEESGQPKLFNLFEKYKNFITKIQNDSINLIEPTDRLNNFFK